MLISKPYSTSSPFSKGFTLVEMMVVVSIFLIMTAIVLNALPSFRDKTSLNLVVKEVVTVLRQMQVYGGATRITLGSTNPPFLGGGSNPIVSYGLYFDPSNPTRLLFFGDKNGNKRYDSSPMDTLLEQYSLTGGVTVDGVTTGNTVPTCNSGGQATSVTFTNPYAQPSIWTSADSFAYTKIKFRQVRTGDILCLLISKGGQITVSSS